MPGLDAAFRGGRYLGLSFEPTAMADLLLRMGPHGDKFLPWSKGLNMRKLKEATHGIDLGELEEGVARRIFHKDGRIHVGARPIVEEFDRLLKTLALESDPDELL